MLNIVSFKWTSTKNQRFSIPSQNILSYGTEHVEKLYRGLKRNIDEDFEWSYTLVTDDPEDKNKLNPNINCIPLWNYYRDLGGCYTRLYTFSKDMESILGNRFICLDLDTVIVSNITSLLDKKDSFVYYRAPGADGTGYRLNCGMYMMDAGALDFIWKDFIEDTENCILKSRNKYVGTDQAWVNYCLEEKLEAFSYWDINDGIYDMRQHFLEKNITNLPDNSKIIVWPGPRDPSLLEFNSKFKWLNEHWI